MTANLFSPRSDQDIVRLVLSQPLAWIVSGTDADFRATLLPVRPTVDAGGRLVQLTGHFPRSNDQVELLKRNPRAYVLTLGAHGYISPSWVHDKTWAPTWNYASAQFIVDVTFFEEEAEIEAHLRDLVQAMEGDRPGAWSIDQMGPRYRTLSRRIIGFRARIRETRAKLKLGQDERDDIFPDIIAGLTQTSQRELLEWMKEFNPGRAG